MGTNVGPTWLHEGMDALVQLGEALEPMTQYRPWCGSVRRRLPQYHYVRRWGPGMVLGLDWGPGMGL